MKRLIIFGLCMLLFVIAATAGPAERFTTTCSLVINAASQDSVFVPTHNGTGFRPTKLDYYNHVVSGEGIITMTVYLPLSAGPISATDSFTTVFWVRGVTDNGWGSYYGPMSDSVRVTTAANTFTSIQFYGW